MFPQRGLYTNSSTHEIVTLCILIKESRVSTNYETVEIKVVKSSQGILNSPKYDVNLQPNTQVIAVTYAHFSGHFE